ncbi:hypothetical protein AUJ65_05025 [Candidatus Micrarchaeota archaeon CG1_02_51_15]|nr:MAG: hypothetical protein AUJ65_05025 [Candidatus Micrarchaeota archaeon CG1_02_51_15]
MFARGIKIRMDELTWPVVPAAPEALRILEPRSNIALCVNRGLSKHAGEDPLLLDSILLQLEDSVKKLNCAGMLTVIDRGVQHLVANVASNTAIDTLILAGKETVFQPSTAIMLLKQNGVDGEKNEIKGYSQVPGLKEKARPFLNQLPREAITEFRQRVKVVRLPLVPEEDEDSYVYRLKQAIDTAYAPRESPQILPFDFSSLCPREISVIPSKPADCETFAVGFENNEAMVQAGDSLFCSRDQDSLIHELNAAGRGIGGSDDEWFALGKRIAQTFMGKYEPDEVKGPRVECRKRLLDLDTNGFFEITADSSAKEVRALYVPTDSKKQRFTLVLKQGSNFPEDLLKIVREQTLLGNGSGRQGHLAYLGAELEKAFIACTEGLTYSQDSPLSFENKLNTTQLYGPIEVSANSIPELWRAAVSNLHNKGLHTRNEKKGEVVEGWCTLWHTSLTSTRLPDDFDFFDEKIADSYATALCEKNAGEEKYTYGDRQCHYFGYDQMQRAAELLAQNHDRAVACQRYYPPIDLPSRGRPCLLGETYWLDNEKLHAFHFARAHDLFRAFPENLYGITKAWAQPLARKLGVECGDLLGLSINNNYRKATDSQNVLQLLRKIKTAPAEYSNPCVVARIIKVENLAELETQLNALPNGVHVLGLHFPDPAILDGIECDVANTPAMKRIKENKLDQLSTAAANLKEKPYDNTNVLSPRDPFLDRDAEASNLLLFQPRVHLGRLASAAACYNVNLGENCLLASHSQENLESLGTLLAIARDLHHAIADSLSVPARPLYLQLAPGYK